MEIILTNANDFLSCDMTLQIFSWKKSFSHKIHIVIRVCWNSKLNLILNVHIETKHVRMFFMLCFNVNLSIRFSFKSGNAHRTICNAEKLKVILAMSSCSYFIETTEALGDQVVIHCHCHSCVFKFKIKSDFQLHIKTNFDHLLFMLRFNVNLKLRFNFEFVST